MSSPKYLQRSSNGAAGFPLSTHMGHERKGLYKVFMMPVKPSCAL
ncbi:hypothetical protein Dm11a5_0449 [Dehalococcoides mccartyi]|uniref:Uncharacterized protein n=1 Tax=Dehalococcoides mccartyi TaxID=61435 RepID=A0A142VAL1_9CHLR|nr:hypothetical protein Dm11a5_0449 [Dehalococcoides mccartyi]